MSIYKALEQLSIQLPQPTQPKGHYVMVTAFGGRYLYTAGTGCAKDGKPLASGLLGREVTVEEGQMAARQCVINLLANVERQVGSLERISRVVKTTVYIAAERDFREQSSVGDGASQLFRRLFGPGGEGVRSAIGVSSLPGGQSVEVEALFELKGNEGERAYADSME